MEAEQLFKTFGPWALVLLSMAWLLKVMVADKLTDIMTTLARLLSGQANHNDRIVRIETVMDLNSCMGQEPACGRRKDD